MPQLGLHDQGWPDGLTISAEAPWADHLLLVPALVDGAAAGGVVAAELGAAAVGSADAGVTKDPHQRLGAGTPALAVRQHHHAWLVPATKARQTLPLQVVEGRPRAGCAGLGRSGSPDTSAA